MMDNARRLMAATFLIALLLGAVIARSPDSTFIFSLIPDSGMRFQGNAEFDHIGADGGEHVQGAVAATGQIFSNGRPALLTNNPGAPTCEYGLDAGVGGRMTYSFTQPFASLPLCFTQPYTLPSTSRCNLDSLAVSRVTLKCDGPATGLMAVLCCGPR